MTPPPEDDDDDDDDDDEEEECCDEEILEKEGYIAREAQAFTPDDMFDEDEER